MKRNRLLILAVMLLALSIVWAPFGPVNAFFTDRDVLSSNWVMSGSWSPESDCFEVNADSAWATGSGKQIRDISISNICTEGEVTIIAMAVSWDGAMPDEHLELVQILDGVSVEWKGTASSGVGLTVNCVLAPAEVARINLNFDSDLSGREFTIEFLLGDGSGEIVTFIPSKKGK